MPEVPIYPCRQPSQRETRCYSAGCMNPMTEPSGRRFNHGTSNPQHQSTRRLQEWSGTAVGGVGKHCTGASRRRRQGMCKRATIEGAQQTDVDVTRVSGGVGMFVCGDPVRASTPPLPRKMEPLKALEDCDAHPILFSFLRWRDILSLASTSTRFFLTVRNACEKLRSDVSCGASAHPMPCDSVHHPLLFDQQVAQSSLGRPSRASCHLKWSLGGPVPPSFTYLNEATQAVEDAEDLLEGCACLGGCDDANSSCPCVQLNEVVQR